MADLEELLRLVSNVERMEGFDDKTGFETYRGRGYMNEIRFPLDITKYELVSKRFGVYRLRDEYDPHKEV